MSAFSHLIRMSSIRLHARLDGQHVKVGAAIVDGAAAKRSSVIKMVSVKRSRRSCPCW